MTSPISHALIVTAKLGAVSRLSQLRGLLAKAGIQITLVESAAEAAAQLVHHDPAEPQLILVDAVEPRRDGGDDPDLAARVQELRALLPQVAIVVVAPDPPPALVIASFRAGATDFIDLAAETSAGLLELLERVCTATADKLEQSAHIRDLRAMVEEFLRDLIRTERRSIDLEHQLELKEKRPAELTGDLDPDRDPSILIIEDDREVSELLVEELEGVGMLTYAFLTGEDAVLEVIKMTKKGEAIDLALVDHKLPGIDGLEAIRQMRTHRPGLAAFLMTGYSDSHTAEEAADLGVVGYVLKPFDDVGGLVARIKEQAVANRDLAREHHYLTRIKQRHDKVLLRYRQIAAALEKVHV
jgi:CheY-like chemotaxis protein